MNSAIPIPLFGGTFSPAKLIALPFPSRYDDFQMAHRPPPTLWHFFGQRKERRRGAMGGQLEHENYKHWRRRWLRWHSRSLLAGALVLQRSERDAYLDDMLKTYLAYGDFTENEIAFIFRRVSHGVRRLASHLDASVCARRAQEQIRAQGLRLMTDAAEAFGRGF